MNQFDLQYLEITKRWTVGMIGASGAWEDGWYFKTREFAEIHKDLCERLEQIAYDHAIGSAAVLPTHGGYYFANTCSGGHPGYASTDDLAFGALVARWTAPLRFKLRRAYWFLMWGERGKVAR